MLGREGEEIGRVCSHSLLKDASSILKAPPRGWNYFRERVSHLDRLLSSTNLTPEDPQSKQIFLQPESFLMGLGAVLKKTDSILIGQTDRQTDLRLELAVP